MRRKTSAILLGLTLLSALGVSACNTMEGLGQDVENAGESIENQADDAE